MAKFSELLKGERSTEVIKSRYCRVQFKSKVWRVKRSIVVENRSTSEKGEIEIVLDGADGAESRTDTCIDL